MNVETASQWNILHSLKAKWCRFLCVDMEIIYVKQKSRIQNVSFMVPFLLQYMYWYETEKEKKEKEWINEGDTGSLALHGGVELYNQQCKLSLSAVGVHKNEKIVKLISM